MKIINLKKVGKFIQKILSIYLDHINKINLIMNNLNKHVFEIEILTKDKQLLFYKWHVQKATEENCNNCWFTSVVSIPIDQGNTI